MFACPTCATPVGGFEPACPACGSDLDIAESPTGTAPQPSPRTPAGEKPRTPSNGGGRLPGERFVPGYKAISTVDLLMNAPFEE